MSYLPESGAVPGPPLVLLAEDSPADAYLVRRRVEAFHRKIKLEVVDSGTKAWSFVQERRPALVILDLNLPGYSGHEVLGRIQEQEMETAVVVLSTSDAPEDVSKAYDSGALGYVCKPSELDHFEHAVDSIFDFWLDVAERPPARR